MRALLAPAALVAFISVVPLAMAAQMSTGSVKAFDAKTHSLTLADGTTYKLPAGFKDPGIKVGNKVQVSWEMHDGSHAASKVTVVR